MMVLVFAPGRPPEVREIRSTLGAMQSVVGGYLEVLPIAPGLDLWMNEEGRMNGSAPNRLVGGYEILGTFFIAGRAADGESKSLTARQIAQLVAAARGWPALARLNPRRRRARR